MRECVRQRRKSAAAADHFGPMLWYVQHISVCFVACASFATHTENARVYRKLCVPLAHGHPLGDVFGLQMDNMSPLYACVHTTPMLHIRFRLKLSMGFMLSPNIGGGVWRQTRKCSTQHSICFPLSFHSMAVVAPVSRLADPAQRIYVEHVMP